MFSYILFTFFTTLASVTPTLISLKQTLKRCLRDDCTFMLCKKQCLNREQASIVTVSTGGGGERTELYIADMFGRTWSAGYSVYVY